MLVSDVVIAVLIYQVNGRVEPEPEPELEVAIRGHGYNLRPRPKAQVDHGYN